ncbi:Na+/H+ antiporter [Streptomyces sp. NPDC047108]|uniref:Na+/H+ antiporter n=1 Tax=Streptomyces sp. NPDC047108 TaxID=3155025 RepID=UPI00340ED26B
MGLEITVVVLAAVLFFTWAARRLRLSEPVLLLVGGCLIGLTPEFDSVALPPEVVLLLFLPALLYWESIKTSLREIRANLRPIILLATSLVLVTTVTVAATAHAFGLSWPVAFMLGAAVAPTDAVAVAAVSHGMPRRAVTMLRAESLVNDGTALALFAVAAGIATREHTFSWSDTALRLLWNYAGGVTIGAVIALLLLAVRRRVHEPMLGAGLSLLVPFAAYLPAELAHASGVLAVVTCGLITSQASPRLIDARIRVQATPFWDVSCFVLNGALFVLVGMQLPSAVRGLESISLSAALWAALAVSGAVIFTRLGWSYTMPYVIRALDRRPQQRLRRVGARQRLPLAWAGVRGAVSLAAALAVPTVTVDGGRLVGRDAIVFITVGVILITLVLLGQTLPAIVRWARMPADPGDDEERLARRRLSAAALEALPTHVERLNVPDEIADRTATELRGLAARGSEADGDGAVDPYLVSASLSRAILQVKRTELIRLRDERLIDGTVLQRVQALLDAEEVRLDLAFPDPASTSGPPAEQGPGRDRPGDDA